MINKAKNHQMGIDRRMLESFIPPEDSMVRKIQEFVSACKEIPSENNEKTKASFVFYGYTKSVKHIGNFLDSYSSDPGALFIIGRYLISRNDLQEHVLDLKPVLEEIANAFFEDAGVPYNRESFSAYLQTLWDGQNTDGSRNQTEQQQQ